ncbi:IclR family transcriptional regulator [Actinoplanes sp. CA-131856]
MSESIVASSPRPAEPREAGDHATRTNAAGRTLDVLSAFNGSRSVLGVSEIAVRAGVPKSTAHRLLAVLQQRGYVRHDGSRYRLTEQVFELGSRASWPRGIRDRAVPFMAELHHETLQTVHLAVLHEGHVLYVEKIFGHQAQPCPTAVGSRNPVHATALGKSMLAFSPDETVEAAMTTELTALTRHTLTVPESLRRDLLQARQDGVASEVEECRLGLACVAAPILDKATGAAMAALSISSPAVRFNKQRFATRVRRAADALSQVMS